ncbi:MAG: DUF1048 domain-containing protein, partial [Symbiobacteriaceae bacterium]|nr:DUF1048 domain-containing protein [Symbiobacteriaceae bacterium]
MKRELHRLLAALIACSLVLSACSSSTPKVEESQSLAESRAVSSPALVASTPVLVADYAIPSRNLLSVGDGFTLPPQPRIPAGFQSKYPLSGDGLWESDPKPIFDPLGGQSAYQIYSKRYETGRISYLDKDYRQVTRYMAGDHWRWNMKVDTFADMLHLEQYVLDLGGEVLSVSGDALAFVIRFASYWWWGCVSMSSSSTVFDKEFTLTSDLWREMRFDAATPVTVTTGMGDGSIYYFTTPNTDGMLLSAKVEVPQRQAGIKVQSYYQQGDYRKEVRVDTTLRGDSAAGGVMIMDHLPQDPGDLYWSVDTREYAINTGESLVITLNEVMEIPQVRMGEELGALLVKGAAWGSVSVPINREGFTTRHNALPRNTAIASQTGDGDTLLWLPAGYWTVNIADSYNRLVPVSAGE